MAVISSDFPQAVEKTFQVDASFYSALGARYEVDFGHDPGLSVFLQRLLQQLPSNAKVLDLGCGTGTPVAATMAAAGHHVVGVDISPEMVRLCRGAVPQGNFVVADMMTYAPPAKEKYDAVLIVLSLFEYDRKSIESLVANVSDWIDSRGFIGVVALFADDLDLKGSSAVFSDDGKSVSNYLKRFMGRIESQTHLTKLGWQDLLRQNGFEMVDNLRWSFAPDEEDENDAENRCFMIAKKV